jgi:hypothetical protein
LITLEQHDKHIAYAAANVPFFWDIAQDDRGPIELTAYQLENEHYIAQAAAKLGDGPMIITAGPVPVEIDIAMLRP